MALWLAVDADLKALDVVHAETQEQAYYQFMTDSIYPSNVIELPSNITLRLGEQIKVDDTNADGYYFSDRD